MNHIVPGIVFRITGIDLRWLAFSGWLADWLFGTTIKLKLVIITLQRSLLTNLWINGKREAASFEL
jgi:hypothetical protein